MKEVLENDAEAYYSKEELLEPLLVMYKSLVDTKDDSIANGKLLDVIRQVCVLTDSHGLDHMHSTSVGSAYPCQHLFCISQGLPTRRKDVMLLDCRCHVLCSIDCC